jgi:UDP-N-acetylmuramyl tripeptide synthase
VAPDGCLVLNADDPIVVQVGRKSDRRQVYFGLGEVVPGCDGDDAADAVFCPVCDSRFDYRSRSYSHLGDWVCPNCDYHRPQPQVYAENIRLNGMRGSTMEIVTPDGRFSLTTTLPGLYSVYNILAATAAAWALGTNPESIGKSLATASCGFGRSEFFDLHGQTACLLLVKNPTGFNEVLRALRQDPTPKNLMFAINDQLADGRDISWLWDVNLEKLWDHAEIAQEAVVTGIRAEDMAVRLKYSGPDGLRLHVEKDLDGAVRKALTLTPHDSTLYILASYTAMLKLWEILRGSDTGDATKARADRTPGRALGKKS